MPYLVSADLPAEPAGRRFRALVERGGILPIPGAHNGIAALQAKAASFEALYLSGAAMTASMGLPDVASSLSTRSPSSSARWRGRARCPCWSTAIPVTARRST